MIVAVLVPFRGGCPWRERAWSWVRSRYEQAGHDVIVGTTPVAEFSRTQAIIHARHQSDADVLVIADADVWPDGLDEGISQAREHGWAVPNGLLHRLSEESTWRVLEGEDWHGLPLSTDNPQDAKPYRIHEAGTLLIVTAEAFDAAPPDPRFVGWGQEDDAWSIALRTLVGNPWRGDADLVHLWHPPQQRQSRIVGNETSRALLRRYRASRHKPQQLRALLEEVTDGSDHDQARPTGHPGSPQVA